MRQIKDPNEEADIGRVFSNHASVAFGLPSFLTYLTTLTWLAVLALAIQTLNLDLWS